jgi:MoaA/NifB/PqqE/SkfB family radical SAM enzyme
MRVPMFVLTGGDPLKRPDLQAIVQYARQRSVKTSLTPSATPLLSRLHKIPALASNHPVFLCMNNQDADGRIRSRDILVQRRLCVLPLVEPQVKERKIFTHRSANFG